MKWNHRRCSGIASLILVSSVFARNGLHGQTPPAAPVAPATTAVVPLSASDPAPTLVTLHHDKASLNDVLADISRQTGVVFDAADSANHAAAVTLDLTATPLWQALISITQQTHFQFRTANAQATGQLSHIAVSLNGDQAVASMAASGPALFTIAAISHAKLFNQGPGVVDQCFVDMDVLFEPRLEIFGNDSQDVPTECTDELGHSLVGQPLTTARRINSRGRYHLQLNPGPDCGNTIKMLKGSLHYALVVRHSTLELTDIPDGPAMSTSDMNHPHSLPDGAVVYAFATLSNLTQVNVFVGLKDLQPVNGGAIPGNANLLTLLDRAQVHVVDAGGKDWGTGGGTSGSGSTAQGSVVLRFNRSPDVNTPRPAKVIIDCPTAYRVEALPFEFHDLPLP